MTQILHAHIVFLHSDMVTLDEVIFALKELLPPETEVTDLNGEIAITVDYQDLLEKINSQNT